MRWVDPLTKGLLRSAGFVFAVAYPASIIFDGLNPSTEFLRTMAGIGASFFLAYVIEATWLAQRFSNSPRSENLLGILTGLAVSGLAGVGFALFLSESAASGHLQGRQGFYIWWSLISLGCLGLIVAMQPALIHFWVHESSQKSAEDDSD